ncbi:MAG: phosphate signaling complex protein PhoU [Oscillospiraceae bacterium]|nr:phosphate signaling complex protein PhoU [Oscillospiraceae bacterium]
MRTGFDEQLNLLNNEMIKTGAMCETAIALSAKTFESGEKENTSRVKQLAARIEENERKIESLCMKLILQQQPVARDLRVISSALKMVTDMERIGHQSADIVEIISKSDLSAFKDTSYIRSMAVAVIRMVTDSIDAFVDNNIEKAESVISYDDTVDDYFRKIKKYLVSQIIEAPEEAEQILNILLVAKYFERIGDHAVNIAEWVIFSITGQYKGD